jgi:hypothetical protein
MDGEAVLNSIPRRLNNSLRKGELEANTRVGWGVGLDFGMVYYAIGLRRNINRNRLWLQAAKGRRGGTPPEEYRSR